MSFPLVSNIKSAKLDGSLAVEVHLHEFFLGDRDRQCWTYLTRGFADHGQREMALSLLIDDAADPNDVSKTPIKMFQLLGERTIERQVDYGDSTRLGQKGIFGFPGLYYVPAIQYEGLPNLDEYLACILVHQEEYQYVRQYGLTRFLSRLGKFCSSFPYPTWNTQARPSLFSPESAEDSLLTDASHVTLDHSCVHKSGNTLQLQLHQSDAESVLTALETATEEQIILNTAFSPRSDASLYWQVNQDGPGAYAAPESATGMLGGSFLALQHSDNQSFSIIEDGYCITLTVDQWRQLQDAITAKTSCEFEVTDETRFVLDFVDVSARPRARPYLSAAIWKNIVTTEVQVEATQTTSPELEVDSTQSTVVMGDFDNLSGENSLAERVNHAELLGYLDRIHRALENSLSDETNSLSFDIELTVYPEKLNCRLGADINLNPEFIQFIEHLVQQIKPCDVTAQIKLRIPFYVNQR